jgi:Cro/C1-type helix-turn-helix DNA-binding protein
MKLTKEIKNAIRIAIENQGTAVELARLTGIKQQNFSRYMSGEVKSITLETWQKLEPYIKVINKVEQMKNETIASGIVSLPDDPQLTPIETKIIEIIKHISVPNQLDVLEYLAVNYGTAKLKHAKAG